MAQRNSSEKVFFRTNPWARLKSTNWVGVDSLAIRLRGLLRDLSKKEFKNVKAEIERMLNNCETELKHFQEAAVRARDGHYNGQDMFDQSPKLRLITSIVDLNEQFNKVFALRGHTRKFEPGEVEFGLDTRLNVDAITNPDKALAGILRNLEVQFPEPMNSSLLSNIESVFRESRSAELGSFSGSMLAQVFREQTKKWKPLVLKHVSQVIMIVHDFIGAALRLKCTDSNTSDELHDNFLLPKLPINRAIGPASVLNAQGTVPNNPSTVATPVSGNTTAVTPKGPGTPVANRNGSPSDFTSQTSAGSSEAAEWWLSRSMLPRLTTDRSNAEQVREDIHDILRSYYKVARKRFVAVVLQQTVFHFLLDAKTSPLKIFTPDLVMGLDDKQLHMIAGEHAATRDRREILARDIENLKLAVEELRMSK
ncbi:hypothetical protein SGCOL_008543 [Colletotrichum sp. CLE4]